MKRLTWPRAGVLLAVLGLITTVSACGQETGEAKGIQLVQAGKLTVCTHLPYEPFQFEKGGEVVGFEKDILDWFAEDLGVEQTVKNIAWESITSGKAFDNETCDVAMGAMTITEERDEVLAFTEGYFDATQVMVAKKGSGLDSLDDLKGKQIGVQTDTTGQFFVQDQGMKPRIFRDLSLQMSALETGRIKAAVNDNGPLLNWLQNHPKYTVTNEFETDEVYGFAAQDDANGKKLVKRLDKVINQAKKDGTYAELHKKWFGVKPDEALSS